VRALSIDAQHGIPTILTSLFSIMIRPSALYEVWRHDCGEYWIPEYGHFIANPVKITERGPKTLGEITQLHQEICAFAKEYEPEDEKYRMHRS
jgi:hypothetical protein